MRTSMKRPLEHPAVDLVGKRRELYGVIQPCARVTCPDCSAQTWKAVADIRRLMARPNGYNAKCRSCRQKVPRVVVNIPPHPAVDQSRAEIRTIYGSVGMAMPVTCPGCGVERWQPLRLLHKWVAAPHFSGVCRKCHAPKMRAVWEEMLRRKPRAAKHTTSTGYRAVPLHAVPDEHQWIWQALRTKTGTVLEHRLAYSIFIGRPLRSNECVDHRDGNKLNNDPSNLRVYLKGQNQEGSGNGYGTYYDEWQRAEARVRELEAQLAAKSA